MKLLVPAFAATQEPSPDQGRALAQAHVELIDVNNGGLLARGIAT